MNFTEHFEKIESYIPYHNIQIQEFFIILSFVFILILARYFLVALPAYFIFWKTSLFTGQSVHDLKIKPHQIQYEIKWSIVSSLVFAFAGAVLAWLWLNSYTRLYLKFDDHGWWYLPMSFVFFSLMHEIYFYLTHLWMHRPKIFSKIHAVHHYSRKVSPWASFSFHPGEALIQAAFLPLAVCVIPIHPVVVIAYLTFMTLSAVSNHLGFEIISSKWLKRGFISGTHHAVHHEKFNFNYGLYYCFMDKIFKTEFKATKSP